MPLLVLGRPVVPPLFPLILPVTRLLQNLPQLPAPLLLPALCLRQLLPQLLHLVWIWWLISPLIRCSRTPPWHHLLLRHHPCSATTLWSFGPGNQRQQIWWPLLSLIQLPHGYCSLLPLNLLPSLMQINILLGMMLCVMRSRHCIPITCGL